MRAGAGICAAACICHGKQGPSSDLVLSHAHDIAMCSLSASSSGTPWLRGIQIVTCGIFMQLRRGAGSARAQRGHRRDVLRQDGHHGGRDLRLGRVEVRHRSPAAHVRQRRLSRRAGVLHDRPAVPLPPRTHTQCRGPASVRHPPITRTSAYISMSTKGWPPLLILPCALASDISQPSHRTRRTPRTWTPASSWARRASIGRTFRASRGFSTCAAALTTASSRTCLRSA